MFNLVGQAISTGANIAGYIPVVSTFTGFARLIYGYAVKKFYEMRLNNSRHGENFIGMIQNAQRAQIHMDRGKVEMIPFGMIFWALATASRTS